MRKIDVSVIIRCCNEWPLVATTAHSYLEDLEFSKIPFEIIVTTNRCTDNTPDAFLDKYRRWVRSGILKVVEFNERHSHWGAANAGIEASCGDYVVVSDAHMSIKYGTMDKLLSGARRHGGIWHAAEQQWNDTSIRTYQYDLKLYESMWGHRCRFWPPGTDGKPYPICMAPHCLLLVSRKEIEKYGAYSPQFATYGGGEPYLNMKWWMMGSSVWIDPNALCRHAFGWRARWETARKDTKRRSPAYVRDGTFKRELRKGDEYLAYAKGYTRSNYEYYKNFALAAYTLGGVQWLNHYLGKARVRPNDAERMRREVVRDGTKDHVFIKKHASRTLNDLITNPPWRTCERDGHGDGARLPEVQSVS